jgi:glucokinase
MDAAVNHPRRYGRVPKSQFLAADVGGTHARVALVQASVNEDRTVEVLAYREFNCGDFSGLPALLHAFVSHDVDIPVRHCVLACAGQVVGHEVVHDNLAWPIRLSQLRHALGFVDVAVLNDFEALGYALADVRSLHGRLLCGPDVYPKWPTLVVGPGTGLGAAVHLPGPAGRVLTTEAGQMDFAPQTVRERQLLDRLVPCGGYVPYEHLVSGPGLLTIYQTLCTSRGEPARLTTPEAVTTAARTGGDAQAVEAVDLFCALLGSFAGNLAMVFMTRGGVYLAGGFLSSMFDLLQQSSFAPRFVHGRSVRAFLERVPVRVIEHGRHGVLGAAKWYLRRLAREPWVARRAMERKSAVRSG